MCGREERVVRTTDREKADKGQNMEWQARARICKALNVMELGLHPEDEALEIFNQGVCNQHCFWKEG